MSVLDRVLWARSPAPLALALALTGWGCSEEPPPVPALHPMVQAAADLGGSGHSLRERITALEAALLPVQELEGEVLRGEVVEGRLVQRSVVLRGTFCYVVFAAGDEGVRELDVELINNNDVPLVVDRTEGAIALLGVQDTLCPMMPEPHTLRVSARAGQGDFEARIYRASVF